MNHFTNLQGLTSNVKNKKIFINFGKNITSKSKFFSNFFDNCFHIERHKLDSNFVLYEPTICVVYFDICGDDEINFLCQLQKNEALLKIIVISESADVDFVIKSFKCGIMDFICSVQTFSLLENAVIHADKELCALVEVESIRKDACGKLNLLTRREREVLDCLSSGHQNKTIASNLNLSVRTIEMFRSSIIEKLQAKNATEAVKILLLSEAN